MCIYLKTGCEHVILEYSTLIFMGLRIGCHGMFWYNNWVGHLFSLTLIHLMKWNDGWLESMYTLRKLLASLGLSDRTHVINRIIWP